VLDLAKALEGDLGRTPGVRFGPRAIDCDLLLWEGGEWRDERLQVPHPRLCERRFALVPVLDLDPGLRLPDGRRLADLLAALDPREQPVVAVGEALRAR
jgi:2-amino-4-hydroxy-6-hydroxymethyldihydropteridine diphosphokinase